MDRFQPLDVSNASLGAHLYAAEEVLVLTEGVGLYSGPNKSLPHSNGTVYLTSHRLFYVDDAQPHRHSCYLRLSSVRETQYYAGFLKSSPKVTLGFRPRDEEEDAEGFSNAAERSSIASNERPKSASAEREHARGERSGLYGRPKSSASIRKKMQDSDAVLAAYSSTSSLPLPQQRPSGARSQGNRTSGDWRIGARPHDAGSQALPKTTWICRVCAFSNALDPSLSKSSVVKCQLCGVTSPVKDLAIDQQSAATNDVTFVSSGPVAAGFDPDQLSAPLSGDGLHCPACTFSNHPSMLRCEMCDTPLGTINVANSAPVTGENELNGRRLSQSSKTREGQDVSPAGEVHNSVRLSFRKGGDKAFYDLLKKTLKDKRWQTVVNGERRTDESSALYQSRHANIDGRSANLADPGMTGADPVRRVGIEGIFSAVDLQSREESNDMQDALRDLEALMTRAKKMVDFAEALNAKLTKQEAAKAAERPPDQNSTSNPDAASHNEAANMIRSSLVRLGLPAPAITADMAQDEYQYNLELARELAGLLYSKKTPILGNGKVLRQLRPAGANADENTVGSHANSEGDEDKGHDGQGILPLDEIWCIWNRARGVALVSPKELLSVAPLLPRLTQPQIECKTFVSGLKVLHTPHYADSKLNVRICAHLERHERRQSEADDSAPEQTESFQSFSEFLQSGTGSTRSMFSNDNSELYAPSLPLHGVSTLELARLEGCPLHLMDELLSHIEQHLGAIVRDEHAGTTTWFINQIQRLPLVQQAISGRR